MLKLLRGMILEIWVVDTRFPANTAPAALDRVVQCHQALPNAYVKPLKNHPNMNGNIEIIKHINNDIFIFTGQ